MLKKTGNPDHLVSGPGLNGVWTGLAPPLPFAYFTSSADGDNRRTKALFRSERILRVPRFNNPVDVKPGILLKPLSHTMTLRYDEIDFSDNGNDNDPNSRNARRLSHAWRADYLPMWWRAPSSQRRKMALIRGSRSCSSSGLIDCRRPSSLVSRHSMWRRCAKGIETSCSPPRRKYFLKALTVTKRDPSLHQKTMIGACLFCPPSTFIVSTSIAEQCAL
ncbi:hypothetical protein ElyMa_005176000 [Elysia marginata]|uniref:Uncharacterized protein n=1 Tax=Elysia marginata TaxID=1093978 RepID=A0AAV4JW38_9GAST|nr:hypothetical protein ElyMa_005176000 [Elysia marginata]